MDHKQGVIKEKNCIVVWALSASVCDTTNMLILHTDDSEQSRQVRHAGCLEKAWFPSHPLGARRKRQVVDAQG